VPKQAFLLRRRREYREKNDSERREFQIEASKTRLQETSDDQRVSKGITILLDPLIPLGIWFRNEGSSADHRFCQVITIFGEHLIT
jgi:hypothetical protein